MNEVVRYSVRGGTGLKDKKRKKEKNEKKKMKMERIGGYHSRQRGKESIILCTAGIFSSERVQS